MSRRRKYPITDIAITKDEFKRLKQGYCVHRSVNGHKHSIKVMSDSPYASEIAKVKAQLRELEQKAKQKNVPVDRFGRPFNNTSSWTAERRATLSASMKAAWAARRATPSVDEHGSTT